MSRCEFHSRLHAYFDGELNAAEAKSFAGHLQRCDSCTADLADLQRDRQLLAELRGSGDPSIEDSELVRLHDAIDREMNRSRFTTDRNFWRTAGLISGLAASVLIVASAWLGETGSERVVRVQSPQAVAYTPWERVALGEPAAPLPGEDVNPNSTAVADAQVTQFMLSGLKGDGSR